MKTTTIPGKDWYTISALAARIGLSRKTVWAWVRDGRLPSHRCGAQHRISEYDWQQFLAECNTKQQDKTE